MQHPLRRLTLAMTYVTTSKGGFADVPIATRREQMSATNEYEERTMPLSSGSAATWGG